MSADFFKRLGWFALFFLVQVLVLGRIHLFHYATPFLYVYFVVSAQSREMGGAGMEFPIGSAYRHLLEYTRTGCSIAHRDSCHTALLYGAVCAP